MTKSQLRFIYILNFKNLFFNAFQNQLIVSKNLMFQNYLPKKSQRRQKMDLIEDPVFFNWTKI